MRISDIYSVVRQHKYYTIIFPECNNITWSSVVARQHNSERRRLGRLQVEAHADGGGPVQRRRGGPGGGGRVQNPPPGPHRPRLLPGEKEEAVVVVRRRGRDRRLWVVRLIYEEMQRFVNNSMDQLIEQLLSPFEKG